MSAFNSTLYPSPSLLKVENLSVGYDRPLIQNLNFELKKGDRLIVYGPNGSGKSTLLSTLAKPASSQKQSIKWALSSDEILFIHQQPNFHSQTPDDVENYLLNILLYKKPFSSPTSSDFGKVRLVLEKLRLPNMPLRHLSGGQRQKLKMARGLLLQTQALLLDEPFNAIDQKSTGEIIEWLNEVKASTIQILVLHDFEQIEKLKSPILWIHSSQWEILSFSDWFQKVDRQFHSWMHLAGASHSPQSFETLK